MNTVESNFSEQNFNVIVTSSSSSPMLPIGITQPSSQQDQVCIVITDPNNQQKQLTNPLLHVPNVISYSNSIMPSLYFLGQDIPSVLPTPPPGPESNISVVTPTRVEMPRVNSVNFFPTPLTQPQPAKNIPVMKENTENLPTSTSSSETNNEKIPLIPGSEFKTLNRRMRQIEGFMKQSIKLQKKSLRHQERMEKIIQHCMKEKFEEQTVSSGSNRSVHFQRYLNDAQPQHLFRLSSQSEGMILPVVESSSPSDSPPLCYESQKDDANSPNLTIDLSLTDTIRLGDRSPHQKYHSHSCSMYNKSIRDFSHADTIQWLDRILPILGHSVTVERIQEVLSQTNTITHFTAEFQKVVFTDNERKTLTTSGKFRKRKLERIVLGPLDVVKLQGIIQLSLYLFGVTEKDEERVKYQLKQAIDEKNRREFYREDRGTKRVRLS